MSQSSVSGNSSPPSPDCAGLIRFDFLRKAKRAFIRHLLQHGQASIDDVHVALEVPPGIDPRCLGDVPKIFEKLGVIAAWEYIPTQRKVAHARRVTLWRLRDAAAAEAWLKAHTKPVKVVK